jgi:hypothetical protein
VRRANKSFRSWASSLGWGRAAIPKVSLHSVQFGGCVVHE